MRRGHPGIGGWRGENTRHFRPRSGGPSHFRPSRSFGLLETPRFAPPGSRFSEIPPYNTRSESNYSASERHDRSKYNQPNQRFERDHHGHRGNYPPRRHGDRSNYSQYQESRSFHENTQSESYLVNSMGDIDHRQLMTTPAPREPYRSQRVSVWDKEPRSYYDEENQNKSYRPDLLESSKLPKSDYIGHRPPASDHYGGNPGSAIDNSNSFSRSVDDTVDLVRKRLLNRNEPQHHSRNQPNEQNQDHQEIGINDTGSYQCSQEAPTKKRVQRQRQNVKNNCDKMKNKIVHQLFKMDKDKIHKLMDNPSSSTKFEYAISSLITESQNSLNRHLRSVAEKSLTTSSDFINNDNNTIYEDTFMKQMQCILDPQDTVFLEDIKPLVMQELSKVLQLDNTYEQPYESTEGQTAYFPTDDLPFDCTEDIDIYNEYPYEERNAQNYELHNPEMNSEKVYEPTEPLFERRQPRVQRSKSRERKISMEQRHLSRMSTERLSTENPYSVPEVSLRERDAHRRSIDRKSHDEPISCESLPIFDSNTERFSEDEDPFADLDKQYHVAVDHNFIQDYNVSPQPSITSNRSKSPPPIKSVLENPINTNDIKTEIDNQLLNIAKSPLEILPSINETHTPKKDTQGRHEPNITPVKNPDSEIPIKKEYAITPVKKHNEDKILDHNMKEEKSSQDKKLDERVENSENNNTLMKSSSSVSARKRSLDQRPSHRKEKRKKSESNQSEPSKQILNKNIIINVNDCAAKKNEKYAEVTAKSIFNLYFSKDEHNKEPAKDTNKAESTEKSYSDKYVKRKEQSNDLKDIKQGDTKKRHRSISSSHSTVSPKANNSTTSTSSNSSSKTPLKSDKLESKIKLKHIDMFTEQARKISVHQANRNTALPPKTPDKIHDDNQLILKIKKPLVVAKNLISKETQTFVSKKSTSRFSQTERKKLAVKSTQTDPISPEKSGPKSTDTFERMKEIDLEIQVLLQEKFKLYSSLETKDTNQTLGMTVLNVPFDDDKEHDGSLSESEDAIVADFTSIPVEELEQIAFESVENDAFETPKSKKNQRHKVLERERRLSRSPSLRKISKKRKGPNISLIEQIITDDRPLEDIISLDDLECSPIKSKRKPSKQVAKPKKKKSKKKGKQTSTNNPKCNTAISHGDYNLKECSVVLNRNEIENYLKGKKVNSESVFLKLEDEPAVIVETVPMFADTEIESMYPEPQRIETIQETIVNEHSVNVNDIHFDMLDVSEDIVIGDVYDAKSNDKEVGGRMDMLGSEELILDNSQSSMEEAASTETVQPDSQCKMYDFSTDENLRRDAHMVTSNPDAVLALECVENNNFLAACLDGNVYHYTSDGQLITTLRGYNQPVTCLNIVREKCGTTVYTGSLDSRIRYYDLESGMEKGPECNVLSPIQSMDRAWDTVFVGTRTGFVLQFECKNNMLIPVSTVKFSEQSILALRAMKEGPRKVLLVAARSEDVTIKDAQTGLLLRTLSGPRMTVYSLLYEDGKVYCGTSSHQIHVFDYASSSHLATHEGGKGVVCLRASGGLLFAGCYDGCVYVYREGEPRPFSQLRGPGIMLLSLAIVGSKIIAGYKDRGLHIWKLPLGIMQEMIL